MVRAFLKVISLLITAISSFLLNLEKSHSYIQWIIHDQSYRFIFYLATQTVEAESCDNITLVGVNICYTYDYVSLNAGEGRVFCYSAHILL